MQELRPHAARLGAAALLASAVATHAADPRLEEIIVTAPTSKIIPSSFSATVRDGTFLELNEAGKALMDAAFALGDKQVAVEPNVGQ